jgi:cell division protein FtsI (penicillin-binding protein 3)
MKMMIGNEAQHGVAMVMEVKTGKIKAIANLGKIRDGYYAEDLNYAITPSEPGSTFKLVTLMQALEDGKVTLNTSINLEGGVWQVAGRTVYDSEKHGKFQATVLEAFEESSNVGMAKIAVNNYTNNPSAYFKHLSRLRLDSLSGIDLVGERRPQITRPGDELWGPTTLPWMAFGYNIAIAPIQTLSVYNMVANNGVMMRPYLVNSIQEEGRIIKTITPKVYNAQVYSPATIKAAQIALEGVCINGTGKTLFKNSPYKVAGKTGTALVANGNKGYADKIYQSSFAGYFPADNPQYTIVVIIKNKPHAYPFYGASVAGPVFKEIADRLYVTYIQNKMDKAPSFNLKDSQLFNYTIAKTSLDAIAKQLSMPYQDSTPSNADWTKVQGSGRALKAGQQLQMASDSTMPDISGMKLKDALWLCEKKGLIVKCSGKGKVIRQSILQGQYIQRGQQITIELN